MTGPDFAVAAGDDAIDINLRAAEEIAFRSLALATALRRVAMESDATPDAKAELFDLRQWSAEQELTSAFTSREAALLATPLGEIGADEVASIVWQAEGLERLLWSIGLSTAGTEARPSATAGAMLASPSPPEAAGKVAVQPLRSAGIDAGHMLETLPGPWDPIAPWVSSARLRGEDEIAMERERAEIWHWLAGAELLWRDSGPADRDEIEITMRDVVAEARATELLADLAREKSVRPLTSLTDGSLRDLSVATAERLRALNWLCGFGTSWDTTPLDV